jgi:anti-sigma B factor antagonist
VTDLVELVIEERGEVVVARVSGELDLAGAPGMGDRIHDSVPTSARALVVDFSELDFIDSSGIAMLFGLTRRLGSRRQELRVVARDGRPVARVLQIVEFDRAARVHETLEEALADLVTDS